MVDAGSLSGVCMSVKHISAKLLINRSLSEDRKEANGWVFSLIWARQRGSNQITEQPGMLCVFTAERRERKTQKPGVIIIKAARALEIGAGGSVSDPRWLGDAEASWAAAPWRRQAELGEQVWALRDSPADLSGPRPWLPQESAAAAWWSLVLAWGWLDACPGCVVHLLCGLGRRRRGSDLSSRGPLRTLGCSINTRGSCQGPGELKTAVHWDKAEHTLSVKGCVLVR